MKTIVLLICLAALAVLAAADETDVEDLGFVTELQGLNMEKCPRRPDFYHFLIEFFPQTPPTNAVLLVTTNRVLELEDLARLPSGPIIMAVRSVCTDSAEAPLSFYRFEILRSDPSPVRVTTIGILKPKPKQSATNVLHRIRARKAADAARNIPPTPGRTNAPPQGRALPDSTSKTYAQGLDDRARQHYARESRK